VTVDKPVAVSDENAGLATPLSIVSITFVQFARASSVAVPTSVSNLNYRGFPFPNN